MIKSRKNGLSNIDEFLSINSKGNKMSNLITETTLSTIKTFQTSNIEVATATDTYTTARAEAFQSVLINYSEALANKAETFKNNADFGTAFTLELILHFDFESTSDLNFFEVVKMVIVNGNYDLSKIKYAEARTIYNLINAEKYAVHASNGQLDKCRKADDYIVAIKALIKTLRGDKNALILAVNKAITEAYRNKSIDDLALAVEVAKVVLSEKKAEAKKADKKA